MRTCTITISIVVHVLAVCAAVTAPLWATDELPAPRTAMEFIEVVPLPEPPAPPPRTVARAKVEAPRADIPPFDVPAGVTPEPVVDSVDDRFTTRNGVMAFHPDVAEWAARRRRDERHRHLPSALTLSPGRVEAT